MKFRHPIWVSLFKMIIINGNAPNPKTYFILISFHSTQHNEIIIINFAKIKIAILIKNH